MFRSVAVLLFFLQYASPAQVSLHFVPRIQDQQLYLYSQDDSISITTFKFYISDIRFTKSGKEVLIDPVRVHLVDASDAYSLNILIHSDSVVCDTLIFGLGIDSLTSVSGAFGGDLDPVNGMYWTWQSGYINLKLEGLQKIPGEGESFQFHLGGYSWPYNSYRTVKLAFDPASKPVIHVNLDRLLQHLKTNSSVMSPSTVAMELSDSAARMFTAEIP